MLKKSLDASLLFSIINLTSKIRLRGDLIYKFAGITTQQYVILLHLAKDPNIPFIEKGDFNEGMLAKQLADSLDISPAGIANLIKTLIHKDLVNQTEDGEDRRKKRLKLTPRGKSLIEALEPVRSEANAAFLAQFTDEEKEQFLGFIERCSAYVKDQLKDKESLLRMNELIAQSQK